jgi:hypothetical protein
MSRIEVKIADLIGKTLVKCDAKEGEEPIDFLCSDGTHYRMCHSQDCCESVSIDQITGDIADLLDTPILAAEESTSDENPPGVTKQYQDSFTWTFYKLATIKGHVDIRWYGESNGYYSERVDFVRVR